jgi:hypothetical protein
MITPGEGYRHLRLFFGQAVTNPWKIGSGVMGKAIPIPHPKGGLILYFGKSQTLQTLIFQCLYHQTPAIPWFNPVADVADINSRHKNVGAGGSLWAWFWFTITAPMIRGATEK